MLAVVGLFLLAMAALGMFGRLRIRPRARKCPRCGRHEVGGTCGCGRD